MHRRVESELEIAVLIVQYPFRADHTKPCHACDVNDLLCTRESGHFGIHVAHGGQRPLDHEHVPLAYWDDNHIKETA